VSVTRAIALLPLTTDAIADVISAIIIASGLDGHLTIPSERADPAFGQLE
jgi:hypothetical protein